MTRALSASAQRAIDRRANHKLAMLRHVEQASGNIAATCRYYGVSRQTYYAWLKRYEAEGLEGLKDRSSAPHHSPTARLNSSVYFIGMTATLPAQPIQDYAVKDSTKPSADPHLRVGRCRRVVRGARPVFEPVEPFCFVAFKRLSRATERPEACCRRSGVWDHETDRRAAPGEAGIVTVTRMSDEQQTHAIQRYREIASATAIGREAGFSTHVMLKVLRNQGVEIRR